MEFSGAMKYRVSQVQGFRHKGWFPKGLGRELAVKTLVSSIEAAIANRLLHYAAVFPLRYLHKALSYRTCVRTHAFFLTYLNNKMTFPEILP